MTEEERLLIETDLLNKDKKAAIKKISAFQKRTKKMIKESTGFDVQYLIPEIGKEISWEDIIRHIFKVLEFNRMGTIIDENNQVKAESYLKPYGYLLAESPILNNKVLIPIIHRDDFALANSVYDEPQMVDYITDKEFLVTYAPENIGPGGISIGLYHVLHYVIVPIGTLDYYYSIDDDIHMAEPMPEKLFGPLIHRGEIGVQINLSPKL